MDPAASLPESLERLASAMQGVLTKRIDLVMLEANELAGALVVRSALARFGVFLALAAWFSALAALILLFTPTPNPVLRLVLFAAINAVAGVAVLARAVRERVPTWPPRPDMPHPPERLP